MARKLEIPGAPAASASTTDSAGPSPDAFQANATDLTPDADPVDPTDLAAVVAAQAKQIAALMGAVQNMQRNASAAPAAMPAAEVHPSLEDLDTSKLTAPTMTDKGWYVPPTFGANPSGQKV